MTTIGRRITELLGDNNGRTVGTAQKREEGWFCETSPCPDETATVPTQAEACRWLLEIAGAVRIIRCPEIFAD